MVVILKSFGMQTIMSIGKRIQEKSIFVLIEEIMVTNLQVHHQTLLIPTEKDEIQFCQNPRWITLLNYYRVQ